MGENLYRIYQSPRAGRTGQTWAVRTHNGTVEIRTGALSGPAPITDRRPQDPSPLRSLWGDMDRCLEQKAREGFVSVGFGRYDEQDRLNLHSTGGADTDYLHWSCIGRIAPAVFDALARSTVEALRAAGQPGAVTRHGMAVTTPSRTWSLHRNRDGLLGEPGEGFYGARDGARTGPGGGRIRASDGVAPTLVLMRIERMHPGTIVFAQLGEGARIVTPAVAAADRWLGESRQSVSATQRLATALGLAAPQRIPLLNEEDGAEPLWF